VDNSVSESGGRRRKLAGYIKAANELRQTYQQNYTQSWATRDGQGDPADPVPGSFPGGAATRSGDEEMVVFPSYARRHVKQKVGWCLLYTLWQESRADFNLRSQLLFRVRYKNHLVKDEIHGTPAEPEMQNTGSKNGRSSKTTTPLWTLMCVVGFTHLTKAR